MSAPVKLDQVSKQYRLGIGRRSFRDAIALAAGKVVHTRHEDHQPEPFWAVRDITFEVSAGEALGIVGPNGAGKTTILKLLSRVTQATTGSLVTHGRVASLIELGAGFHPDLTGRENVFLNGTILGLSQSEIRQRFDNIVAFAELEQFIDTPVKRYSSGMYARLGFAVAAHVEPDILLVDEVLSVGDESFQQKCHDFIHSFVESGRTSVFVSHNLYALEQLCDRLLWLDHGKAVQQGSPGTVLRAYMDETDRRMVSAQHETDDLANDLVRIPRIRVMNASGQLSDTFRRGDAVTIAVDYETNGLVTRPYFCVWISDAGTHTPLFSANMLLDDFDLPGIKEQGTITCQFKSLPLMPKAYNVWVEVYGADRAQILFKWRVLGGFRVLDSMTESNLVDDKRGSVRFSRAHGSVYVPYEWSA